jgi:hypothetical protein
MFAHGNGDAALDFFDVHFEEGLHGLSPRIPDEPRWREKLRGELIAASRTARDRLDGHPDTALGSSAFVTWPT